MTPISSTLLIFSIQAQSLDCVHTLNQICNVLSDNINCVVVIPQNMKFTQHIKTLIDKYFVNHINKQQLSILYQDIDSHNLSCLISNIPAIFKYDWIVTLPETYVYLPNSLVDIINNVDTYDKNIITNIVSYGDQPDPIRIINQILIRQTANQSSGHIQKLDHRNILSNALIFTNQTYHEYTLLNHDKFAVIYFVETKNLLSGYSIIYKKNFKVFNVENECGGKITHMDDKKIVIVWNIGTNEICHTYIKDNNIFKAISIDYV